MLLSTYEPTQSIHKNNSNDSIKSINSIGTLLTFFGNPSFPSHFWHFWINWIDSIMPVTQSHSTQSPALWKRIDSITNQLVWKRKWTDSINFAEKMNRFKLVNSIELIGVQVCLHRLYSMASDCAFLHGKAITESPNYLEVLSSLLLLGRVTWIRTGIHARQSGGALPGKLHLLLQPPLLSFSRSSKAAAGQSGLVILK